MDSTTTPSTEVECARRTLGRIYDGLTLWGDAACYLHNRGIDPDVADRAGVRSVQSGEWGRALSGFDASELEAAGIWSPDEDYFQPFWWHRTAFTVFPFYDEDERLASLRFRRIDGESKAKVVGLLSVAAGDLHRPPLPFGAPEQVQLAKDSRDPLYVVEGELDAISMWCVGRRAVAAPGASSWPERWCWGWEDLPHVMVLADGDDAGARLADAVAVAGVRLYGAEWLDKSFMPMTFPAGVDASDLLEAGELASALDEVEAAIGIDTPRGIDPILDGHTESEREKKAENSTTFKEKLTALAKLHQLHRPGWLTRLHIIKPTPPPTYREYLESEGERPDIIEVLVALEAGDVDEAKRVAHNHFDTTTGVKTPLQEEVAPTGGRPAGALSLSA